MGFATHPSDVPGGEARDSADGERLRHARERDTGFPVGRYLQPPPMLFTRDGHNVFLGDMFRGHACFLICGGPSLTSHDLAQLERRGVLTCAVNNAATVVRPRLWVGADDPGNFCDVIWRDPGILKFVPLCHMEKPFMVRNTADELVPSQELVGDMPAVFGFRRNEAFVPEQWLYEDTFNWGNHSERVDSDGNKGSRSVMYIALRLLFYLGVRRVFLLGCDFRMELGAQNYAFEQGRTAASVRSNNSSYRILNARLDRLKPYFDREGFQVFNCTPRSGLTVFPHLSYEEAMTQSTAMLPRRIVTAGMYDRQARERAAQRVVETPAASSSDAAANVSISPITLVLAVDEEHFEQLRHTWPTWMRFKPELRQAPVVVAFDAKTDLRGRIEDLLRHPNLRLVAWQMNGAADQRELMLTALVRVAAEEVQTPWYLKLDTDVVATGAGRWLRREWFATNEQGREPVFVASPWGYTKPADTMARLDDWGDTVPVLRDLPRLNLPFDPSSSLVAHPRIISWCFLGNTAWTREVARFAPGRLPCPSHDTYLYYCAARRGDHFVRVSMAAHGWEHVSRLRKLRSRCEQVLAVPIQVQVAG